MSRCSLEVSSSAGGVAGPCVGRRRSGRDKALEVAGEPGRIWLIAPPGGSAGVNPRHYEQLKNALIDALTVAVRSTR